MDRSLRLLYGIGKAVAAISTCALFVGPLASVAVGYAAGFTADLMILLGGVALGLSVVLPYYALKWTDLLIERHQDGRIAKALAQHFAELHRTGHPEIRLRAVAYLWAQSRESVPANMKWRDLKSAVRRGLLLAVTPDLSKPKPNLSTYATTRDLAEFFRSRAWLEVQRHPYDG